MLALPAMVIVFVLDETINQGIEASITADLVLRVTMDDDCKSATVTKFYGNVKVERGKPHKRETQILVGELI